MTRDRHPPSGDALPVRRLLAVFASLRLAIVLLSLFTLCLAGATAIESAYSARVAQALVYRAWWFSLLLLLLALNVFGAALKKFPWRRHQTGFLVTHAGLIVLLLGGLLTTLFGIEGQMILVDTKDHEVQARLGVSNNGSAIYLDRVQQIDVFRLRRPRDAAIEDIVRLVRTIDAGLPVPEDLRGGIENEWTFPIDAGVFTWESDGAGRRDLPWVLDLLDRIASPWPGISRQLDGHTVLSVRNFYAHVEDDPGQPLGFMPRVVRPGSDAADRFRPALRCTLTANGRQQEFGVVLERGAARTRLGDSLYLIRYRPAVLPVPFALTLQRAWQVKDPGSERSGWFQSDVTLASATIGAEEPRAQSVSMNHTVGHGLYKVYQANYRRIADPATGAPLLEGERPVSLSGLTVAYDPGLWLKYAGALTVVAGIVTMFWMRAYFFKPQKALTERGQDS